MRKLKFEKTIKIDHESIVKINIDKILNETNIIVATGYLDGQVFIPIKKDGKSYKIEKASEKMSDDDYFKEVDKQNAPSLAYYGLLYRAKQAGVFIMYSAKKPESDLSVVVTNTTITIKLEPLVTTNQEIIDAIVDNHDALSLIYKPKIIDINADVDTQEISNEIK